MNLPLELRYNFHLEEWDTGDKLQFWVLMMANLHICEVMDAEISEGEVCDSRMVVTPLWHMTDPLPTSRPARITGMHSADILGRRDIWCLMMRKARNHGRMKRMGFRISFECYELTWRSEGRHERNGSHWSEIKAVCSYIAPNITQKFSSINWRKAEWNIYAGMWKSSYTKS
jgi:hypothetical protein